MASNTRRSRSKDRTLDKDALCRHCLNSFGSPTDLSGYSTVKDKNRCLLSAAVGGHAGCVKLLLSTGADVNTQDEISDDTALMLAAQNGYTKCTQLLIEAGADVNTKDQHGATAVILAAAGGHHHCVELLVQTGADVNQQWYADTALLLAVRGGFDKCVKLLINAGADVNLGNDQRLTALMYAAGGDWRNPKGNIKWVKHLTKAGADVNAERHGYTALRYAVENELFGILEILAQAGADC